jgi:hypothetical protein
VKAALTASAVRLLHPLAFRRKQPLCQKGEIMNQYPPQAAPCEQEEVHVTVPVPEEEVCADAREWRGLPHELLDRVLDP